MQVTHYFDASLTSPVITRIQAMQGDGGRMVVARLKEGTKPWLVPEGTTAGLSYELPGKDPGYYDLLSDGTPACIIEGNQVSAVLDPVLMERPGPVTLSIILRDPEGVQVATFPFCLWVERVPGLVNGENLEAPPHIFDGKIYYGGTGGGLRPLGFGTGIRTEEQEDGSILLVAACEDDPNAHAYLLPRNLGAENVGRVLVVGGDGNIVLTELPQGGDVTGTLDENNDILLSGDLAEGTYTLKWCNADGTYSDAGTIVVGQVKPAYTNQIPISTEADGSPYNGGQGWKTDWRLSSSSGGESSAPGVEVTGFIPYVMADKVIYIKGIEDDGTHAIVVYNEAHAKVWSLGLSNFGAALDGSAEMLDVTAWMNEAIDIETQDTVRYIRICANVIDGNSILTVNEPIE